VPADRAVAERVRAAVDTRAALRIVGHGTWLDGGYPVRATNVLSLADDRGVVEYVPGDLTITVRAGTTLAEIAETLGAAGQWLPLDPLGRDTSTTIGAVVATGSYGPLAAWYGTPRDQVLGLTVVTGNGVILKTGGRVVKNVAGFDLTRLMTGAWGTLGVITQVTMRVRARTTSTDAIEHLRRPLPTEYGYREPIVTHPRLATAIKRRFDPEGVLNPGILGAL
jgi:glycolate oxidase FAD binding subunit